MDPGLRRDDSVFRDDNLRGDQKLPGMKWLVGIWTFATTGFAACQVHIERSQWAASGYSPIRRNPHTQRHPTRTCAGTPTSVQASARHDPSAAFATLMAHKTPETQYWCGV